MLRFAFLFIISSLFYNSVIANECTVGTVYESGALSTLSNPCPTFLHPMNTFCCINFQTGTGYCCSEQEFLYIIYRVLVPIGVGAIILFMLICCVSCLYCSCCLCYRKRHRGTVYGQVVPAVVDINLRAPPADHRQTSQASPQPPYPVRQQYAGIPMPGMVESPPSYSMETYVKQPAYNPNYRQ